MRRLGMDVRFDPRKSEINRRKHGVDLSDAEAVLFDPMALIREDCDSQGEQRFVMVGGDGLGRVLTVVYTYREPDMIRLISAPSLAAA